MKLTRASKRMAPCEGSRAGLLAVASLVCLMSNLEIRGVQSDDTSAIELDISMPNVRPNHPDKYLCVAKQVPVSRLGHFIVGIKPRGSSKRVHHMLLYGCHQPGLKSPDNPDLVWDCGAMQSGHSAHRKRFVGFTGGERQPAGPICGDSARQQILYGWAMDAPELILPRGVGFKVGGSDTDVSWLVLQVHYGHMDQFHLVPRLTDNSGLLLSMRPNLPSSGIKKRAGVLLLASYGIIPMGKSRHEIWCDIDEDIEIHPFRFRVHTHRLGTRVLGAKLSSRKSSVQDNRLIGKEDPQRPQTFYPVKDENIVIKNGDQIYASCEFNNNSTHMVKIGQTKDDEMCNFYLMYWTDSSSLLKQQTCYYMN